ncbi:MAG: hypothetical protein IJ733_06275, partial [Lachnospiraceae bacterium]|nr:hypothetical protein [Lachnospiraceae bacterium]
MKKLLIMESVSAGILILLVVTIIQMSACGKKEKMLETEAENSQIRISKDVWMYAGEISEGASPLEVGEGAEKNIWGLCFSNVFLDTEEEKNTKGRKREKAFFYNVQKKEEEKKTYLTIGLRAPLRTVSGGELTADDLLFNYYFRCDPSADSETAFAFGIEGGKEYYYGTKKIKAQKKRVKALLKKPGGKLKKRIQSEIILPELYEEYEWVEQLFSESEYQEERGGYSGPEEFFAHFYAYQTSYRPKEKSKEEILSDIAEQYGANYQALEKVTGKSYEAKAEGCALAELFSKKKEDHVKKIKGIRKLDAHTIQVVLLGTDLDVKTYLDFWILPLEPYGMESGFWEKENEVFGKGGAAYVYEKAKREYRGSGSYYCFSFGKETICFYKNPYDIKARNGIEKIYMRCNQS